MRFRLILLCVGVLSLATVRVASASDGGSPFVRPAALEPDIAFWRRIYTEVTTDGGLIHDDERLDVVYEVVNFSRDVPQSKRSRYIEDAKSKIVRVLKKLGSREPGSLTADEEKIRDLWPENTSRIEFANAAERVRFQLGQADRFKEGLIRSGTWMARIVSTFERMGLPRELAALPHVESSFNTYAYSRVGAAGMWQFMRSTGKRFLRIDNTIDERLDPYKATAAAATFLEQNYSVLGSWPLALTAYNHGAAGMRRARDQLGTADIATIVRKYDSKTFGFASRNFYVAFLAALEVDSDPEKFFPGVKRSAADASQIVVLSDYMTLPSVARALNVDADELHRMNPALLSSVVNGSRRIPRGFELRIPSHIDFDGALARLPSSERHTDQVVDRQHRVRRGETLASIAQSYRLNVVQLAEVNGLRKPYRVRVGQNMLLPEKGQPAPALAANTLAANTRPPEPAVVSEQTKQPPQEPAALPSDGKYIVRPGDTLSVIATKVGMSEAALIALNGLRDRDYLYQGQVLALTAAGAETKAPEVQVQPPPAAVAEVAQQLAAKKEAEKAEPASESEAESQSPALLPGVQATASADPSDYSVHKGETIQVEAAETIGHYADWLEVGATRLRKLNRMSKATPVVVGRHIKLDFSKVSVEEFESRRAAYHRQLQEAFFSEYRIVGSETHIVKAGESIWVLAQKKFNVPIWLLRQYNPDIDMAAVKPGARIVIPKMEAVNASAPT